MMDLRDGIERSARALGVSPVDLATAISYETAGTFDPAKAGPTTQWGQHRGLIQFGEPQAQKYGVDWNNPVGSQLGEDGAVVKYLRDTGVQPGMGLLDIYSAINSGGVGHYGASDANNGGAPGTVRDKVEKQMAGHRAKAESMFGGSGTPFLPGRAGNDRMETAPMEQQDERGLFGMRPELGMALAGAFQNLNRPGSGDHSLQAAYGMKQQRSADAKGAKGRNATADWLRRSGMGDYADLIEAGAVSAGDVFRVVTQQQAQANKRNQTDDLLEFEFARQQGYEGDFVQYQREIRQAGATHINNNVGNQEGAFAKETGKLLAQEASDVVEQGALAQRNLGSITRLGSLLEGAKSGASGAFTNMAANLGIKLEGASELEAANAIISQLVPQQRPPGSGQMSDADLELFKQSLPRIINTPEGNQTIIDTLMARHPRHRERAGEQIQR